MSEQVLRFLQEKPKREIQFGYSRISQELLPTFEIKQKLSRLPDVSLLISHIYQTVSYVNYDT